MFNSIPMSYNNSFFVCWNKHGFSEKRSKIGRN